MFDDNYSDSFDEIDSPKANVKSNPIEQKKPLVPPKPAAKNDKFEIESDNNSLDFNANAY